MTTPTPESILTALREGHPLVHNITNYVVMNSTANALLAAGASPVMAHAPEEMREMASIAQALVLNIGTLSSPWIQAMHLAGETAAERGIPIVLDPVGAGATTLRTDTSRTLLATLPITAIRGNASEVLAVAGENITTRGVDSTAGSNEAVEAAKSIAAKYKLTVVITGETDIVTDGERTALIKNGHPLMGRVTGTGCSATALLGAFLAIEKDAVAAGCTMLAYYGLAGERAAEKAQGPGTFWPLLLDQLYSITPQDLAAGARISYL